jgi:transcriptional regulator of acetoin/glycerol metabolism
VRVGTRAEAPRAPSSTESAPAAEPDLAGLSPDELADRARIIATLEACAGNQTRAAKQLGISRGVLVNRLRIYRIPRPQD